MKQRSFEYDVAKSPIPASAATLNQCGKNGWELVCAFPPAPTPGFPNVYSDNMNYVYIFKKETTQP